ncbi:hypothetical protein EYR40_007736 [Pleurotus pulmonarius]|nr:hypothetical protein EYR38_007954 [Pleurotus pulmonarius]KAF4597284.1 hypothetical protein EYR40_007736 [Pleurotus pulmonarius]
MIINEKSDNYRSQVQESYNVDRDWEDLSEADTVVAKPSSPAPEAGIRLHTRKRRSGGRPSVVFQKASTRRVPALSTVQPPRRVAVDKELWLNGMLDFTSFGVKYIFDVVRRAVWFMKFPISFLLFVWMLAFVTVKVQDTLRAALSPACFIPGISNLRLCRPEEPRPEGAPKPPRRADYPAMVDMQSRSFEELLDQSVFMGGGGLSLNIKKAEIASRDLLTLIKYSDMKSKDVLLEMMDSFILDAQSAGRSLNKLNAKIGGAVDSITSVNNYALRVIEEAQANAPSAFSLKGIIPWSSKPDTQAVVTATFTQAMELLSTHLRRLILEAEISHASLEKLEERLSTLHEIVTREDVALAASRAELFADLWTVLGGNRDKVDQHDNNLALLKNLGGYRNKALSLVVSALHTLRGLSEEIENLRERVSEPELIGSAIPVEVHMESIKAGLGRLQEGRLKAKEREAYVLRQIMGEEGITE